MAEELISRVDEALRSARLDSDRPLLAAVSGGTDSMTLLDVLWRISHVSGQRVIVCHMQHGLRGQEAEEDAAYVEEEAALRGLQAVVERADTRRHASEKGLSLEDAARALRYGFLARVAAEVEAEAAATAHTLDDQAETVLLHITRGSGLAGVRGMRPVSKLDPALAGGTRLTIIRPMLGLTRADTEEYCRQHGIAPREDSSNADIRYARNRIRHNVMPELRKINPRAADAVDRLAETASEDLELLSEVVADHWERGAAVRDAPEGKRVVRLRMATLLSSGPALRRRLLRRAYAEITGGAADLEQRHVRRMEAALEQAGSCSMDLPGGIRFRVRAGEAVMAPRGYEEPSESVYPPSGFPEGALTVPGDLPLGNDCVISAELAEPPDPASTVSTAPWTVSLDADAVGDRLRVRSWRAGDRMQPFGMEGTRKLQDIFVDAGVPREERARVPLVETERGIAWAAGVRLAHWARVTAATRRVLRLRLRRHG